MMFIPKPVLSPSCGNGGRRADVSVTHGYNGVCQEFTEIRFLTSQAGATAHKSTPVRQVPHSEGNGNQRIMCKQEKGSSSMRLLLLLIAHLQWRVGLRSTPEHLKRRSLKTPSASSVWRLRERF